MNSRRIIRKAVFLLLSSIVLTAAAYTLFALVFSTDTEKLLIRENRLYDELYSKLQPEEDMLGETITALQLRDAAIYKDIFHSEAPNVDPVGQLRFLFGSDTIPDSRILAYTFEKAEELCDRASNVESAFMRIFVNVCADSVVFPPMSLPLDKLTYSQVGAGPGMKINPFYGMETRHDGLDLIAAQGAPVRAVAPGVVALTKRSTKGRGREVVIRHDGGYVSSYAHLSEINVREGSTVKLGQTIGLVGMSGNAFAPHLHYEISLDGALLNPVNYIFASVTPQEYSNMLFMSSNTRQSMD